MGVGGFLASKAELDQFVVSPFVSLSLFSRPFRIHLILTDFSFSSFSFHYLRKQTHERVLRSCNGEMERAIHGVLGPVGVEEPLSRLITENLRKVETAQADSWNETHRPSRWWKLGFGKIAKEETGAGTSLSNDAGITGFLMKGENLGELLFALGFLPLKL